MTHDRGSVFIGDLLRSIAELQAPRELWPDIARTLGLHLSLPTAPQHAEPAAETAAAVAERTAQAPRTAGEAKPPRVPATAAPTRVKPRQPRRSQLRPLSTPATPPPMWMATADVIPAPAGGAGRRLPPEPLFVDHWTRGIVAMMLATSAPSGEVDVRRLVDAIAGGRPLTEIPRACRATLARGAQICVDVAAALMPFAQDQAAIVDRVRRVIGGSPVQTLYFAGCPARGAGSGHRGTWKSYAAPTTQQPVLLLTDLGIGRPRDDTEWALPGEWVAFLRDLHDCGCPVVALSPYPPERVPRSIRPLLHVITWDRSTSVRTIRKVLGTALELP